MIRSVLYPLALRSANLRLGIVVYLSFLSDEAYQQLCDPAAPALAEKSKNLESCKEVPSKQMLHLQPCSNLDPPETSHNV